MSSFDFDSFSSLIDGDKGLFQELLKLFREDWPQLMNRIDQAVREQRAQEAEMAAHRLKGMVKNFFADRASELAGAIEDLARENDLQSIPKCLKPLRDELLLLESELSGQLEKL